MISKQIMGLEEMDGLPELYIENVLQKTKTSLRRKHNFGSNHRYTGPRRHWTNHSGHFKDEELRFGPKYWHGRIPLRIHRSLKTHKELVEAITLIASGEKTSADYHNINGINELRLRLAQSWKDRGKKYKPNDIIKLSFYEIRQELGFNRQITGRVIYF